MPPSRWVIVTCTTAFSWREAWKSLCFNLKIFWPGDWGGLGPLGPPCLRQCAQYTLQRLHSELSHARVRVHCCPVFSWQFTRLKCDIQSDRHATYALSNDNIMSHKLTRYMKVTGESAKKWNKIGGSTHTADCFPSHHPSPLHSFSFILDRRRAGRGSRGPDHPPPQQSCFARQWVGCGCIHASRISRCSRVQCSICRWLKGFNPPLVEDDPHTGDWKLWSGFDPRSRSNTNTTSRWHRATSGYLIQF